MRIAATLIVRNEAHVIERCLASVRPLVTHWAVVDTGSTDGTQDVVRRLMADLPGALIERPWDGFGVGRTQAFELARTLADWSFVIDADDLLVVAPGFQVPALEHDAYRIDVDFHGERYRRRHLYRLARPWRFVGAVHERAVCDEPTTDGYLAGLLYRCVGGGGRSANPEKLRDDARALDEALAEHPDDPWSLLFAGHAWADAGDHARARGHLARRAALGGPEEEVHCALLGVARASERLGDPPDAVVGAYLRAHAARPGRAEPLYELARYCRERHDHALAWIFARAASEIPLPEGDNLFLRPDVYAWRVSDELAMAAYYTGRHALARELNERLLAPESALPEGERARVRDNLGWAERALWR